MTVPVKSKIPAPLAFLSVLLASCFYVSYLPTKIVSLLKISSLSEKRWTGAGLMGSLFGLGMYIALPAEIALSPLWLLGGVLLSVGVSHLAEKVYQSHDDSRIVIDEWIGVWIALWGFNQEFGLPILVAFLLFRFFDVWKGPWGNALQKLPGGWGITMDDVAAGVLANVVTRGLFAFFY